MTAACFTTFQISKVAIIRSRYNTIVAVPKLLVSRTTSLHFSNSKVVWKNMKYSERRNVKVAANGSDPQNGQNVTAVWRAGSGYADFIKTLNRSKGECLLEKRWKGWFQNETSLKTVHIFILWFEKCLSASELSFWNLSKVATRYHQAIGHTRTNYQWNLFQNQV